MSIAWVPIDPVEPSRTISRHVTMPSPQSTDRSTSTVEQVPDLPKGRVYLCLEVTPGDQLKLPRIKIRFGDRGRSSPREGHNEVIK